MGNLRLPRTNDFLIYLYFLWYLFDQITKTKTEPIGTGRDATGTRRRAARPTICKTVYAVNNCP